MKNLFIIIKISALLLMASGPLCGADSLMLRRPPSHKTIYAVVYGNQSYFVGSSTQHSGLFVSVDSARTWRHLGTDNLKAYGVDAVDSAHGRILFLAAGNGVHRSTDYGATWKIVTDWRMTEVMDVKVDQREPRVVYAATAFGLWKSTDGGESWREVVLRWAKGVVGLGFIYSISMEYSRSMDSISMDDVMSTDVMTGHLHVLCDSAVYISGFHREMIWWTRLEILRYRRYRPRCILYRGEGRNGPQWFFGGNGEVWAGCEWFMLSDKGSEGCESLRPMPPSGIAMSVYSLYCTPDTTLFAVGNDGVRTCRTGDMAWRDVTGNLPNRAVHAIAGFGELTLIGTFGDGLYRREAEGWVETGLAGSQVWSLTVKDY